MISWNSLSLSLSLSLPLYLSRSVYGLLIAKLVLDVKMIINY
jgi:hypothetical protein